MKTKTSILIDVKLKKKLDQLKVNNLSDFINFMLWKWVMRVEAGEHEVIEKVIEETSLYYILLKLTEKFKGVNA